VVGAFRVCHGFSTAAPAVASTPKSGLDGVSPHPRFRSLSLGIHGGREIGHSVSKSALRATPKKAVLFLFTAFAFIASVTAIAAEPPRYEKRAEHDPNGIGVFYMGREMAHVVGGRESNYWLDRPEREEEEHPAQLIEALHLKPGDVVADIGAGTGYITQRLAAKVGEKGIVYAEDIQQEELDIISARMREKGVTNVKPVLGTLTDPKLPAGEVDLIIMVDVYHEFDHPYEMAESMIRALKPGGRLVFVEFRKEDRSVPIKEVHKMSIEQVKKEMAAFPALDFEESIEVLPEQHIIIFRRE
jgi:ubiquinone/menaquinone biosynthesis C-methylase UbiE